MQLISTIASAILIFTSAVHAAPIAQLAGEGAASNSILSSTDNGIGFGIKNAEDNTANLITKLKGGAGGPTALNARPSLPPAGPMVPRQLAGEGAAANSILSDTDNGVGFGVKNAEDNLAGLITSMKGGAAASTRPKQRRQLDKVANGFKNIGSAAGVQALTEPIGTAGDSIDGSLTSGVANAGADIGSMEESTLEAAGNAVPRFRRQLDKIANGFKNIGNAVGLQTATDPIGNAGDSIDGSLTSGVADLGAEIGSTEETTLEQAGSAVPRM